MLLYDPQQRITAIEALCHPFFDDIRDPNTRLPNDQPLPPVLNFSRHGEWFLPLNVEIPFRWPLFFSFRIIDPTWSHSTLGPSALRTGAFIPKHRHPSLWSHPYRTTQDIYLIVRHPCLPFFCLFVYICTIHTLVFNHYCLPYSDWIEYITTSYYSYLPACFSQESSYTTLYYSEEVALVCPFYTNPFYS